MQRRDQRKRHLLLLQVEAEGLSYVHRAVVKKVVADLEGQPKLLADRADFRLRIGVGIRTHRARNHASRNQRRCFVGDDAEVDLLVNVHLARLFDLQEFAFAHPANRVGDRV